MVRMEEGETPEFGGVNLGHEASEAERTPLVFRPPNSFHHKTSETS